MNTLRNGLERLFGFLGLVSMILAIVVGASWFIYQEQARQLGALAISITYAIILVAYKMYVASEIGGQE